MSRIAVSMMDIVVPGVTVYTATTKESVKDVVRYKHFRTEKYVYGILEHRGPQDAGYIGWFDDEIEAVEEATNV